MDLFTLVAKLTLDPKQYNQALKEAETSAKGFGGNVSGTISADDRYSSVLHGVESAADSADADVSGDIEAVDEYTGVLEDAERAADNADTDVTGDLDAVDTYSGVLEGAESAADNADTDVTGDIDAEDSYTGTLEEAESAADSADLDAEGTITAYDETADAFRASTDSANVWEQVLTGAAQGVGQALGGKVLEVLKNIGATFAEMINSTAQSADAIDKGSQRLGISARAYQEWGHALSQSGASIGDVSRGFLNLNNAINGSAGADVNDALRDLGINAGDYAGDVEGLFSAVMFGIAGISDSTKRTDLVTAIFGRNGTTLNALFNSGVSGMQDLIEEANTLGLIMSDQDIQRGVAYGDALANMQEAVDALKESLVIGIMPVLTDAMTMIAGIVGWLTGRVQDNSWAAQFERIDHGLATTLADATTGEQTVVGLIGHLREISDGTVAAQGHLDEWDQTAQRLIQLCPSLANQIDTVNRRFTEETQTLEENAAAWFRNIRAQAVSQAMQDKQALLVQKSNEIVEKQIEQIEKENEAVGHMTNVRSGIASMIGKLAEGESAADDMDELERQLELNGIKGWTRGENGVIDISGVAAEDLGLVNEIMGSISSGDDEYYRIQQQTADEYRAANEATSAAASAASEIESLTRDLDAMTQEYDMYVQASTQLLDRINSGELGAGQTEAAQEPAETEPMGPPLPEYPLSNEALPYYEARETELEVDTEHMYAAVADAVSAAIANIQINMDGQTVGNLVTGYVSRNINRQQNRERYGSP